MIDGRARRAVWLTLVAALVVAVAAVVELRPEGGSGPQEPLQPCQASFADLERWAVMTCRPPENDWVVLVTDDGGRHWQGPAASFSAAPALFWFGRRAIVVGDVGGAGRIWAGANGGSWRQVASLPRGAGSAPVFADPGHGMLLSADGTRLWRTTDGGRSWERLAGKGIPAQGTRQLLGLITPDRGLLAVEPSDAWPRVLETEDGGEVWRPVGPPPPPGELPLGVEMGLLRGGGRLVLWMVAELRDTTATGGVVARLEMSSSPNGSTWGPWTLAPGAEGASPLMDPSGGLWLSDAGLIWHSRDGGRTWTSSPLPAATGYGDPRLVFVDGDEMVAMAFAQGAPEGGSTPALLLVSRAGGGWHRLPLPPGQR